MPSLGFSGFDRSAEADARALLEGLGLVDWVAGDATNADAVLIDLDSMYGQMAWMRGVGEHQIAIGLTSAARATTPFRTDSPLSAEALAEVLAAVAGRIASPPGAPLLPSEETTALAAQAAMPESAAHDAGLSEPRRTEGDSSPAEKGRRLGEHLREADMAFRLSIDGLPDLVIDPERGRFAPGGSLKALLPWASTEIPDHALLPLSPAEADSALAAAGHVQPIARLKWLLALGGGGGVVHGHALNARFMLAKWPQAEREFPKHFRIATVMLKAPATVSGIALASGASEADVADYINAALAVGHANAT